MPGHGGGSVGYMYIWISVSALHVNSKEFRTPELYFEFTVKECVGMTTLLVLKFAQY